MSHLNVTGADRPFEIETTTTLGVMVAAEVEVAAGVRLAYLVNIEYTMFLSHSYSVESR